MANSPSPPQLWELSLALNDLSWWISRFGPAQVGLIALQATELAVLRAILNEPDRRVSDVAESMSMQSTNVSAAVRSLLDRGLVEKRPDARDRRASLLRPTAQAFAEREAIVNAVAGTVSTALSTLPGERVDALLDALPALRDLTGELASSITKRMAVSHHSAHHEGSA